MGPKYSISDGEEITRYILGADSHLENGYNAVDDIVHDIEAYGSFYDCDGMLFAGDAGELHHMSVLLDADFPEIRAVPGDHDEWYNDIVSDLRNGDYDIVDADTVLECRVAWQDGPEDMYDIALRHAPQNFDTNMGHSETGEKTEPFDIVMYGHTHAPLDGILDDGTLAIGAGSLDNNFNASLNIPKSTFHVIELGQTVTVKHVDFDTGELVECNTYAPTPDGFEETNRYWTWDSHYMDRFR